MIVRDSAPVVSAGGVLAYAARNTGTLRFPWTTLPEPQAAGARLSCTLGAADSPADRRITDRRTMAARCLPRRRATVLDRRIQPLSGEKRNASGSRRNVS
jgi:hypothetical protein